MVVDMLPFMGAMFGPPGTTAESIRPTADQMRVMMRSAAPGQLSPTTEAMVANMTRSDVARPMLLGHARDSDPIVVANAFHELIVTDLRPELTRINVPTTVLYVYPPGVPISAEQMDAFYAASFASLANAQLKKIPESNHFIMIDQPARFQAEVATFMAR
jgi:pimeloyl-ACP methyl ester carboxylesterase